MLHSWVFAELLLRYPVTLVFGPVGRHWSAFVFVITALGEITGLQTQKSMKDGDLLKLRRYLYRVSLSAFKS